MRALALVLVLLASCRVYAPGVRDCAFRCGEGGLCPVDTVCTEGFCRVPGATERCECHPGDTRPCADAVGECTGGTQACNANNTWSACEGGVKPVVETCDNKDNNCDGAVDNAVIGAPACALTLGVCAATEKQCAAGAFVACAETDYGPNYQRVETLCDDLDNDCDGFVDGSNEVRLAQNVTFDWDFFGYPGGFALLRVVAGASAAQRDVKVDRFDQDFVPVGTATQVTTVSASARVAARADGPEIFVVVLDGATLAASQVTAAGSVVPLATGPANDLNGTFQLGLSSTTLVAAYRSASGTAKSIEWPRDGRPANALRLDVFEDGGTASSVTTVFASRGGRYVAWEGSDNSGSAAEVHHTGSNLVAARGRSPGPASAQLLEGPQGQLASVHTRAAGGASSAVYLTQNLLDGGAEVMVQPMVDPGTLTGLHAVSGPNGAVMVWLDGTQRSVVLASQLAIGNASAFSLRAVEAAASAGAPRVATTGTPMLGLATERNGAVFARRICRP
jgi:hypothetical protein